MTPKEKAEELIQRHFKRLGGYNKEQDYFLWQQAIEVANITVESIIESKPLLNSLEYWEQVKEHLI